MNRKQRVVIDDFTSSSGLTSTCVPQGSEVGLFLFLSCINDIFSDVTNDVRLFTDDISPFVVVDQDMTGAANSLTIDLDIPDSWSKQWVVDFNAMKTINLNFTRKRNIPSID